ncbi:MAG: DNA polymerase [Campylobacterales bacterium]|nr:DNA polymerase [Campylobacterales bacterium]
MQTVIFDIETDNLLLDVTKLHVGVTYCIETKETKVFYNPIEMVNYLNTSDIIIGHNIIAFDIPALEKLSSMKITPKVKDTLLMAQLIFYDKDRSWSHSLDAYGERLKFAKGKHSDWTQYSKEMEEYCIRDVEVTTKLYNNLISRQDWLTDETLEVEQQVQRIITKQYINGWTFDVKKAEALHIELVQRKEELLDTINTIFKPKFIANGSLKEPKKVFKRNGVHTVGIHQPIIYSEFNPSSGQHIYWWIEQELGKQEWILTEKGTPKTDADSLTAMFKDEPFTKPLLEYFDVNKLLGQLAEGDKAWLKLVRNDGKLHGQVNILGTNTGRATHNNPNLAQVPSPRAFKGKEVRSLFTHTPGMVNVGCDLSGVELRCLAHYMALYDNGEYAKIILEGDIHTANQKAAGLPTRDSAKTFIYALLYGASGAKIGSIIGKGATEGNKLKKKFLDNLPALAKLLDAVTKAAKRGYLVGITGRRLHIRSPHSALNVLLQSLGAYISKIWLIEIDKELTKRGIKYNQLGWIHDEVQIECYPKDTEVVKTVLVESATRAGELLQLRCRIDAEAKEGLSWYEVH